MWIKHKYCGAKHLLTYPKKYIYRQEWNEVGGWSGRHTRDFVQFMLSMMRGFRARTKANVSFGNGSTTTEGSRSSTDAVMLYHFGYCWTLMLAIMYAHIVAIASFVTLSHRPARGSSYLFFYSYFERRANRWNVECESAAPDGCLLRANHII